jgi:hypothetical protein
MMTDTRWSSGDNRRRIRAGNTRIRRRKDML